MARSTISIQLPQNEITNRFLNIEDENKMNIIELGMCAFNTLKNLDVSNKEQELLSQLEELKVKSSNNMNSLMREHNEYISRLQKRFATDIEIAASNAKSSMVDELSQARVYLETQRKDALLREDMIRDKYESQLEELRKQMYQVHQSDKTATAKANNSSVKGRDGETTIFGILTNLFPTAEVADLSKQKGKGDYSILDGDVHMMVEVKNYSKNVNKGEVTKFLKDVTNNPEYTCAVLVSLNTGISSKKDLQVEIINGRPVVYLHCALKNPDRLKYVMKMFELVHSLHNVNLSDVGLLDCVRAELKSRVHRYKMINSEIQRHSREMTQMMEKEDEISIGILKTILERGGG